MSAVLPLERLTRPSPLRSLTFGDWRLTHVPDGMVQLRPEGWFTGLGPDDLATLAPYRDPDGFLVASVGGLLIEHQGRSLLIDTGFGPRHLAAAQTHPALGMLAGGDLITLLRTAGVNAEAVDTVAFTHLHDDHIGWVLAADGAHFEGVTSFALSAAEWRERGSLLPAKIAGRVRTVADGGEVFPGVTLREWPGHTSGHAGYVVEVADERSGDDGVHRVLVLGDALHSPAQTAHPEWRVFFDGAGEEAVGTRRAVLEEAARPGTVCYAGHFADVVFGRVEVTDGGYRWQALE
ncbi:MULTISPECIES: MBL fold metallo-hydrolase [unclassified Streptomyces]|uniref:MBL fold metallo-hydrolase n=1 Tax=unclassified Streptomyces TaxID=2593676 RepID=UPI00190A3BCC|nr:MULTISPECIES: MBL fold metallo-hydrolase [unclassified Streptomyces]MBK3566000.1 MBL fold metallo-hydrolase [Streptomyces sp. MBT62]MBK6014249.1 MBL fold metallo-hydrolase [Streptomyces sp. MBT53]